MPCHVMHLVEYMYVLCVLVLCYSYLDGWVVGGGAGALPYGMYTCMHACIIRCFHDCEW